MKIRMSFTELQRIVAKTALAIHDKMLADNMKNILFHIKDDKLHALGVGVALIISTEVKAEWDKEPLDFYYQLKHKDISDILAVYRGLTLTKVEEVTLHLQPNEARLHIHEEKAERETDEEATQDIYRQDNLHRVITVPTPGSIKQRVNTLLETKKEKLKVTSEDLRLKLDMVFPVISEGIQASASGLVFTPDYIYTHAQAYVSVLPNNLNSIFSGFILKKSTAAFLRGFLEQETVLIHKEERESGQVILTLEDKDSHAIITTSNTARSFDVTPYATHYTNGVEVDKRYMSDVLKRLRINNEDIYIRVRIAKDGCVLNLQTKSINLNIPVLGYTLEEGLASREYGFRVTPELLSSMVFDHLKGLDTYLMLHFNHEGTQRNMGVSCGGNTKTWLTCVTGLAVAEGKFNW